MTPTGSNSDLTLIDEQTDFSLHYSSSSDKWLVVEGFQTGACRGYPSNRSDCELNLQEICGPWVTFSAKGSLLDRYPHYYHDVLHELDIGHPVITIVLGFIDAFKLPVEHYKKSCRKSSARRNPASVKPKLNSLTAIVVIKFFVMDRSNSPK